MEQNTTFEGDDLASLFGALVKAQGEMGTVIKDAVNPHFKSKYADLATVCDAVIPPMNRNGLVVMQCPSFDGTTVTVDTIVAHISGARLRSVLAMRPGKNDPQGVGSAITYCRRYALQSIAGVAPEDDDGNAASKPIKKNDIAPPVEDPTHYEKGQLSSAAARKSGEWERLSALLDEQDSLDALEAFGGQERAAIQKLPATWQDEFKERFKVKRSELRAAYERSGGEMEAA